MLGHVKPQVAGGFQAFCPNVSTVLTNGGYAWEWQEAELPATAGGISLHACIHSLRGKRLGRLGQDHVYEARGGFLVYQPRSRQEGVSVETALETAGGDAA